MVNGLEVSPRTPIGAQREPVWAVREPHLSTEKCRWGTVERG